MAYGSDIDSNLAPDHRWSFDGDVIDTPGTADGTNTGCILTDGGICMDTTNCLTSNGITDTVLLPTTTDINNSAQSRKVVAGWFATTAIQNPPKNIYGEGDATQAFRFILGWGNYVVFEVDDPSFTLQVFGDVALAVDRPYHLCMVFEGNGYSNEVRAYLDGVEQLNAEPTDRQPDAATLTARSVGEFGDPAGTVAVGGTTVILISPINGKWNEWCTWDGIVLPDATIRDNLFERGALPDITISSGTEAAMQTALDAYADTVRGDAPLCIRVEAVTGDSVLVLTADNITFDPLASIHVQYMGTTFLGWINANGGNASIGSTPNGATILFANPATLTVNGLIDGCEIRIYLAEVSPPYTELDGTETLSGTTFDYNHMGEVQDIIIQMIAANYEEVLQRISIGSEDQSITLFPIAEENI